MLRLAVGIFIGVLALKASAASDPEGTNGLTRRRWFEARTSHFQIYSCGPTQEVARVATRLEQFREAYAMLAGAQAVASQPIVVMAFPDQATMQPFLPLYQGKPASFSAYFKRSSDQNLIILPLSGTGEDALRIVFHEYAHLLLRHNEPFWPLWLAEGMAEIYSTFEVPGGSRARFGAPIALHRRKLEQAPLMPLEDLFAVTHRSPEYNEEQYQGEFYAESWLLTHYLMLGGDSVRQAGFRALTPLIRQGKSPEQAFTNALQATLPGMEAELRRYLEKGKFATLELTLHSSLDTARSFVTRGLTPMEVCYRLGEQLRHLGRLDAAESYFLRAEKLGPSSPLSYEGLGFLAAQRRQPSEAVRYLRQAMQLGPLNFLGHYTYAREQYLLGAKGTNGQLLATALAAEIRNELQRSVALMPDFGPAQHLLGLFEMAEGGDLPAAEKHVARAIQLEPENQSYVLTLARVQLAKHDPAAARRVLETLCLPYVPRGIRANAQEMIKGIAQ
jgi:tetratricopeptide (TPR) repeat protein